MISLSHGFSSTFPTEIEQAKLRLWPEDLLFDTFYILLLNTVYYYARCHSDRLLVHKVNACLPEELLLTFVFRLVMAFKLKTRIVSLRKCNEKHHLCDGFVCLR